MEDAPDLGPGGRRQLDKRLAAIRTRLSELRDSAAHRPVNTREWEQRVEAAQRHAAAAQAAVVEQLTMSAASFRRAAEAHDRAAAEHERAAARFGRSPEHTEQAAIHRAAAVRDRERAEQVESLLSTTAPADASQSAA